MLKLSDFDYFLPKELIAQYPLKERETARLLVAERKSGRIEHRIFKDIGDYFSKPDLLVLNDTRVLPGRLIGRRVTGGRVEVLLLEHKSGMRFKVMFKPARLKAGEQISFSGGEIRARIESREELTFLGNDMAEVYGAGVMPLPPYIKREAEPLDNIYYQTVYAREDGAVASPTAGLHFTDKMLGDIKARGMDIAYLTLHVGPGTFRSVKSDDITEHKMEAEYFKIPQDSCELIRKKQAVKERIVAVGTTSLRALETYALGRSQGLTDLFVYPGYAFKLTGALLTNFHLPRTTLFMLVAAFAGEGLIKEAYRQAIDRKYRFYSYGDAMLIL
ncbi:MAG: tRNA preQ1(34) S-adenosylmethionine ribosyltransferase-isomerase QueA [Candidatus Omnitrophota bacterium]